MDMAKRKKVVRMSPLTIALIEVELLTLAELTARDPDMTPVKLHALGKWLRRAMGSADDHPRGWLANGTTT